MSKSPPRSWLSPPEVGRLLGIQPDRVLTPIRAGKLPAIDVSSPGSRRPRYRLKLEVRWPSAGGFRRWSSPRRSGRGREAGPAGRGACAVGVCVKACF